MSSFYPGPDQVSLPAADELTPDQRFYVGWLVQHNRLWIAAAGLFAVIVLLVGVVILQAVRYRPSVQYVTLDGGYPVVWNDAGNPMIDGNEYVAPRFRHVVMSFIDNRYAYDWQNPQKFQTALRYMDAKAAVAERERLRELDPLRRIVATRTLAQLKLDYSNWKVVAQGKGAFQVTVEGQALLTDGIQNTDPDHPAIIPVKFSLLLQTVTPSDVNPFGYVIVAAQKDYL